MFKLNYFALEILIRVGLRNATQNLGTLITTLRLESGWNIPQNHPHVGGRKKKWSGNIARWLVLENEIPKKVQQCDLQMYMYSRTPKADGSVQLAIQAKCLLPQTWNQIPSHASTGKKTPTTTTKSWQDAQQLECSSRCAWQNDPCGGRKSIWIFYLLKPHPSKGALPPCRVVCNYGATFKGNERGCFDWPRLKLAVTTPITAQPPTPALPG